MEKRFIQAVLITLALFAGVLPSWAEFRLEKDLKLEPGGRFVLESDAGSVTVTGSKESGAHVVVTSDRDDLASLFDFAFEEGSATARVTARKKHWTGWPKHLSLHYEVRVPTETRLQMKTGGGGIKAYGLKGNSELETSGGSVEVSGLAGRLDAHTSGGGISLREVDGNARVETSGGGIEVTSVDGSLEARTSGGPIRIEGVSGHIDAHTSGGSVHAIFDRGNSRGGVLETSGGSIEVKLDPNANLNLEASTSGGNVTSDLPIKVMGRISASSLQGVLGSGGETLRLHTSGGSIHIQAR